MVTSIAGCKRTRVVGRAQAARGSSGDRQAAARLLGSADEEESGGNKKSKGNGNGMNRYRDCGVYVDGRPVGVLAFGELPIGLKPTWVAEEHSVEFDPGYTGPRTRTSYARRYKVIDYLKAAGVDVAKIKEVQLPGTKPTEVIIASGKELRSPKGQGLMIRFGAMVGGKPIPVVPDGFGNGLMPDKVSGLMVYINKKPPTLDREEGLQLDGKTVEGIPYYGEPMKGGVRVYLDDRLTLAINAQSLEEAPAQVGPDGKQHWNLTAVLKQNGVDLSKVVEAWAIADERRKQRYSRAELDALTFTRNAEQKNQLLVGDGKLRIEAIALHSHQLTKDELPQIRPEESLD
jgi:hypothetical protein